MKSLNYLAVGFLTVCCVATLQAQTSSPASASGSDKVAGGTNASRTDIYHVHFAHAAAGKVAELGESFKTPGPAPAPDHQVVFRHQYGDSWDYCVIAHYGTKFTIEAARQQVPEAQRALSDWHTDTICNGPSWADFSRVLGLGDDAKKTSNAVYVVSYYRAAAGQRDAAEKNLATPPDSTDKAAGQALLQHLEGAAWHFVGVVRYNSWQDMATSQASSVPKTSDKNSPWSQMRDSVALHTDTLCDRIQ
jgi:hypothetical protein